MRRIKVEHVGGGVALRGFVDQRNPVVGFRDDHGLLRKIYLPDTPQYDAIKVCVANEGM